MEYSWGGAEFYRSSKSSRFVREIGNREKIVGKPNEVTERAKEFFSFISKEDETPRNYATTEFRSMSEL